MVDNNSKEISKEVKQQRAMEEQVNLGQWLVNQCQKEHLSLRQAALKTGSNHSTIRDIMNGSQASPETIRKLARGFGGEGINERLALEDHLLVLAGHRTPRPKGEEPSEPLSRLMDKVKQFSESQIKMMVHFADFLIEIEDRTSE